jgi:uncharacterized protein (DUF1800 family)
LLIARGTEAAALALHRFGFGPSSRSASYSIAALAADPRGALLAELERPRASLLYDARLPSSAAAERAVFEFRAEQSAKQKLAARAVKEAEAKEVPQRMPDAANVAVTPLVPPRPEKKELLLPQRLLQDEAEARLKAAVGADIGFVERLVWFWSNHFCVSADKVVAMAGAYEREAIRAHVLGRFADMLGAVERHPAMLFYLDNVQSMGAHSIAGINRDRGLNENFAREILELHTLGVRTGYTQEDVTSFANVLTGWSWIDPSEPDHGGTFVFIKRLHEPGEQVVLGQHYHEDNVEQGGAVLAALARHPATAQHIARKLACHFVADEPPPSLVAKLVKTFQASDGSLKELAKTLVVSEESWAPQRTKLKPPAEWIVGMLRISDPDNQLPPDGIGMTPPHPAGPRKWPIGRVLAVHAALGQPLWRPPAPKGYADTVAAWIDGIPRRLDVASEVAGRLPNWIDPTALLDSALGPLASEETRRTVARAESRAQAFALLIMAPEFLRR